MAVFSLAKDPIPTVIICGQGPTSVHLGKVKEAHPHAQVWTCNSNMNPSDLHFDIHYIGENRRVLANPFSKGLVTREKYPFEAIMREFRVPFFKCAISYMVAFAIYMRFERIVFCGVDYILDHGREPEEKANIELWVGVAMSRRVEFINMAVSAIFEGKDHFYYGMIGGPYEGDWMPPQEVIDRDKAANKILAEKEKKNG